MLKGISIIICCYNSASRLPETLHAIASQRVSNELDWEVILVNNNSIDQTVEVAIAEWSKYKCSAAFKIVEQPLPGLSHAREKGIEQSQYEYLLFCDDDNWLCETYINDAYEILSSDPLIGALGGIGTAFHNHEYDFPFWFDDYKRQYATGTQWPLEGGDTTERKKCLYGAGLLIKKSALGSIKRHKLKRFLTDRKGVKLSSGGDTEITYLLRLLGYKLWYSPKLEFIHYLPPSRVSWQYIRKLNRAIGGSNWLLEPYKKEIKSYEPKDLIGEYYFTLKKFVRLLLSSLKHSNLKEGSQTVIELEKMYGKILVMWRWYGARKEVVLQAKDLKNRRILDLSKEIII